MEGATLLVSPVSDDHRLFHRSHSSPDLLFAQHRTFASKSLPSLPAFDVPAISFGHDDDLDLRAAPVSRQPATGPEKSLSGQTSAVMHVTTSPTTEDAPKARSIQKATSQSAALPLGLSRTRSLIERPRSWLGTARSSRVVSDSSLAGSPRPGKRRKNNEDRAGRNVSNDVQPGQPTVEGGGEGAVEEAARQSRRFSGMRTSLSMLSLSRKSESALPAVEGDVHVVQAIAKGGAETEADADVDAETEAETKAYAGLSMKSLRRRTIADAEQVLERLVDQSDSPTNNLRRSTLDRASGYLARVRPRPQSLFLRNASLPLAQGDGKLTTLQHIERQKGPMVSLPPLRTGETINLLASSVDSDGSPTRTGRGKRALSQSESSATGSFAPSMSPASGSSSTTSLSASIKGAVGKNVKPNQGRLDSAKGKVDVKKELQDPLADDFHALDAEFARFMSKTTLAGRMAAIRQTLPAFLQRTAHHSSNNDQDVLSHAHVLRRTTVLNKWWGSIMDLLDETATMTVVMGADRPVLLDCITMIMIRPEWRLCTSYFQPLGSRSPGERVRARSATVTSEDSSGTAPWLSTSTLTLPAMTTSTESAEEQVRRMFVTGLTSQLAVVVKKLCVKNVPASLASFAGKTCAYAFFFVPGAADILVRLWPLNSDLLRRMVDEMRLPRRSRGESEDMIAFFPPSLGPLGWSSIKAMSDRLRRAPRAASTQQLSSIPWHSGWLSKWRGEETDTFFVFCKYFFVLSDQFMPVELPLVEKARAPGFVLVLAQMLSILDDTIHRYSVVQAQQQQQQQQQLQQNTMAMMGTAMTNGDGSRMMAGSTSDTQPAGADLALMSLPPSLPASNFLKGMAENRIIVLLRDLLSASTALVPLSVTRTFVESFMAMTKAATRRTSRFEYSDCFMLCDFLEEALTALHDFKEPDEGGPESRRAGMDSTGGVTSSIDWPFWVGVWKMMLESNNSLSQIRLLSFVYTLWDVLTADAKRKEMICLDWLLQPECFASMFNSYNPMIRAYYMRLLCWRVCRDSGSHNELDTSIFLQASDLVYTNWCHFLWLRQDAETSGRVGPSELPSLPSPGRRFVIIRKEQISAVQPGLLIRSRQSSLGAGTVLGGARDTSPRPVKANAAAAASQQGGTTASTSDRRSSWSLIGKVLALAAPPTVAARRPLDDNEALYEMRRRTAAGRMTNYSTSTSTSAGGGAEQDGRPLPPPKPSSRSRAFSSTSTGSDASSTSSSPVFDATRHVFQFCLNPVQPSLHDAAARELNLLDRPRLPAPAQARVGFARRRLGLSSTPVKGDTDTVASLYRLRSESPPPPAPGRPPATRSVSGLLSTGLVDAARNANTKASAGESVSHRRERQPPETAERPPSLSLDLPAVDWGEFDSDAPAAAENSSWAPLDAAMARAEETEAESGRGRAPEHSQLPLLRPTGVFAAGATYTGRALAEWLMVVRECNSFVVRRRDEGVLGLSEVEVPSLGVDGLRR